MEPCGLNICRVCVWIVARLVSLAQPTSGWTQSASYLGVSGAKNGGLTRVTGPVGSFGSHGLEKAVQIVDHQGDPIPKDIIYSLLRECMQNKDLAAVRRVHSCMVVQGLDTMTFLGNHLIRSYALCGSLEEGKHAFSKVSKPNVYTWNAILSAHTKLGEGGMALDVYQKMQQAGVMPDLWTFLCIVKGNGSTGTIGLGRLIHDQIIRSGLELHVAIGNTIIDMYARCGSVQEARKIFDKLANRNVVSWGVMILGYAHNGWGQTALEHFEIMQQEGINPSRETFLGILKACGSTGVVGQGRLAHDEIIRIGLETDLSIGNSMVDMYGKCGNLDEAYNVFDMLSNKNEVSWGAMISGYVQHSHDLLALRLFDNIQKQGINASKPTFLVVLKACACIGALEEGRLIHHEIIKSGWESFEAVGSSLVDMYAKCGSLEEAHKLFDGLYLQDVVSWGAIIEGYAGYGHGLMSLNLFEKMQEKGIQPSRVTFLSILKACGSIGSIQQGRILHDKIIKGGFEIDVALGNALVDMYAKCRSLEDADEVFNQLPNRTVISWSAMIAGYAAHGGGLLALQLFEKMRLDGVDPDTVAFSSTLKACGDILALGQGRLVHEEIIRSGLNTNIVVGSTLIDMYSKCGSLQEAQKVFDEFPKHNLVSWGAMIAGYAQHGQGLHALELFGRLREEGMKANRVIHLSLLKACCSIGAIVQGRQIHDQIIRSGLQSDVFVANTLVDMYAKCGSLLEAHNVFDQLQNPDVVSCAAMIAGYAQCGKHSLAGQCLETMLRQDLKPNDAIFVSILSACSHVGVLPEGHQYFKIMRECHGIAPSIAHYSSMIDLLGRAGHLQEAEDLLETMPVTPNIIVWLSLLTNCRKFNNLESGMRFFDQVSCLNPSHASGYVIMSNIYAEAQKWEDRDKMHALRKCAGALKKPGRAWIEINTTVCDFTVGDQFTQSGYFQAKLERLNKQMKGESYVPQVDIVLEPLKIENKEGAYVHAV